MQHFFDMRESGDIHLAHKLFILLSKEVAVLVVVEVEIVVGVEVVVIVAVDALSLLDGTIIIRCACSYKWGSAGGYAT